MVLLLALCTVVGCGSTGATDRTSAAISETAAKGEVADAQVQLDRDAISGGNLTFDSDQLLEKLRAAADVGVSSSWINGQVADAEQVVTSVGCDGCFSIIDRGRR